MRKRACKTIVLLLFLLLIFNWSVKIFDNDSHVKNFKVFTSNGTYTTKPPPFIYGTTATPRVLDPVDCVYSRSSIVIDQVAETLFTYNYSDPSLLLIPLLATGYYLEPTEKLEYTIYLRQGVTFHDGSEFNSAVAKWNFDRIEYWRDFSDSEFLYYWEDGVLPIWDHTEIVNEYTIKFILNKPNAAFLDLLTHTSSAMLSMESIPFYGKLTLGTDQIIGTGPFVFEYYNEGIEARFHAFENYWREMANIDEMVFKYFSDLGTLNSETLSHNINFLDNPDPDLLDNFKADPDLVVLDVGKTYSTIGVLAFNNFLLNNTIRKALSYAINYSYIIDELLNGTALRSKSPIPPGILYSNTTFNYPNFNITKARTIMQSKGYGAALDPNYPGLNDTDWESLADSGINNFSMWVHPLNQFRSDIFNLCNETFRKIGINLYKREADFNTFSNIMEQDPNWVDMWVLGWGADYNDPSNFINTLFSNISIANFRLFGQVNDSYLQNLINLGTEEFDPVLRKGIYDEIQRYIVEELMPSAWFHVNKQYHVHSINLTGFSQNVMEKTYFYYCTWQPHTYKVSIESSGDISFVKGSTGKNITWTITARKVENPTYNIFIDDVLNETDTWQNNDFIIFNLDNLPIGLYEYKIEVSNAPLTSYAYTVEDVIIVYVYSSETPFPYEIVLFFVILIAIAIVTSGIVFAKKRMSKGRVISDEEKAIFQPAEVLPIEEKDQEIKPRAGVILPVEAEKKEILDEEEVELIIPEVEPEEIEPLEEEKIAVVEEIPEEKEVIEEEIEVVPEEILEEEVIEEEEVVVTTPEIEPKEVEPVEEEKIAVVEEIPEEEEIVEEEKALPPEEILKEEELIEEEIPVKGIEQIEKFIPIQTLEGHMKGVASVAFSPDGKYIVSGSKDKTIKIWEVSTGKLVRTLTGHKKYVNSVIVSFDGKYIISGSNDETVKVWEFSTGELIQTLEGHSWYVLAVTVSPDGNFVVSSSFDKEIKVWDLATGDLVRTLKGHTKEVGSIAISPDNKYIVSGSGDKTLKVWDISTGELIRTLRGHKKYINSVIFSPDGKNVISGSGDKTVKVWDFSTGEVIWTLEGHTWYVLAVAVSPDGKFIVSSSFDKYIKVWNLRTGDLVETLKGHRKEVESIAISPDSNQIVSGSNDKTIKIWKVK